MLANVYALRPQSWVGVWLAFGALLGPARPVAAADGTPDARLRIVEFRPNVVLPLIGFVGYHIHLQFAPDERFLSLGAGDSAILDVGAEANHLLLKPKQPTAGTNLTILTNRRVYFIDFRALARQPQPAEAVYSVEFRYPEPSVASARDGTNATLAASLAAPTPVVNRDYWFCGDPTLRPALASDDGIQIRLTFPPRAELPAIYARAPDGAETLVNTHVENDAVVVHRLAERLVLRRGGLVGCVVNHAFNTLARRAAGGTVRQTIERTTRESEP
jgi:type IV secretion system protein VirB9